MNYQTRIHLDRVATLLRNGGVAHPLACIDDVVWLVHLKVLSDRSSRSPRGRVWRTIRKLKGMSLVRYLRGVRQGRTSSKSAELAVEGDILLLSDRQLLEQLIATLDQISFGQLGLDVAGDIVEYLCGETLQSASWGQYRTPRQIRSLIIQLVDPQHGESVLDPACGTGGLLIDAANHILAVNSRRSREVPIYGDWWLDQQEWTLTEAKKRVPNLQTVRVPTLLPGTNRKQAASALIGIDLNAQLARLAMTNLSMSGLDGAIIRCENALDTATYASDSASGYDVVVCNPPFKATLPQSANGTGKPSSASSQLHFIDLAIRQLAPGGRCAIVVPAGVLYAMSSAHRRVRRALVHDVELLAVVSLPVAAFRPNANVKTAILVFRKPRRVTGPASSQRPVLLYDLQHDGFDTVRIQRRGRAETPSLNDIPDLLSIWQKYQASEFMVAVKAGAAASKGQNYSSTRSWWTTTDEIAAQGYILTPTRYEKAEPIVPPPANPTVVLRRLRRTHKRLTLEIDRLIQHAAALS